MSLYNVTGDWPFHCRRIRAKLQWGGWLGVCHAGWSGDYHVTLWLLHVVYLLSNLVVIDNYDTHANTHTAKVWNKDSWPWREMHGHADAGGVRQRPTGGLCKLCRISGNYHDPSSQVLFPWACQSSSCRDTALPPGVCQIQWYIVMMSLSI